MIVPAEQEFQDRFRAARLRMTTGLAIKPRSAPIVRQHMRNGVAVTVRGFVPDTVPLPMVFVDPAPKPTVRPETWAARAKYRTIASGLPGTLRNDRVLAKRIVRELWRSGLSWRDIIGQSRRAPHVAARFRVIRIVSDARPRLSLPSLGKLFHRDHASILHALRRTAP